jgi:hypothetical protein
MRDDTYSGVEGVKLAAEENCRPTRFDRDVVDIIQYDKKKDEEEEQSHESNQKH